MKDLEVKLHHRFSGRSTHGRSTCTIECPFCGRRVMAYIWSLAGSGKKCECGALHSNMGHSSKIINNDNSNHH